MRKLICLLLILPLPLFAAENKGLKLEEEFSWPDVLARAELENKFILVNWFSTSCYFCYKMKTEIFVDEAVGKFYNEKFISVELEYDSTSGSAHDARWVSVGAKFKQVHGVIGYPTYLFFSPSGKMVKHTGGYMKPDKFIELGNQVMDPDNELTGSPHLLEMYKQEKEQSVIKLRELHYKLWDGEKPRDLNPDWTTLRSNLESKCGVDCAANAVFHSRPLFYKHTLNPQKFVESVDEQMQKFPPRFGATAAEFDSISEFRLSAQWVLDNADDKALLERAVAWIESCEKAALNGKSDVASMHVRARLLQKLGRKDEAISTLEKALAAVKVTAKRANLAMRTRAIDTSKVENELNATLEKVKKGEPNWPIKGI